MQQYSEYIIYLIAAAVVLNVLVMLIAIFWLPRIFSRQESRNSEESTRIREILLDVLGEQEAVTLRQSQIGSSLNFITDQLNELQHQSRAATLTISADEIAAAAGMPQLQQRLDVLQGQISELVHAGTRSQQERLAETESWGNLIGLLATMQDRINELNQAVAGQQAQPAVAADRMLDALESEMQSLRSIADEIAGLQWKLRRSVIERETSLASLRAEIGGDAKVGERAA